MPYISQQARSELYSTDINEFDQETILGLRWAETPGELNYIITQLINTYLDDYENVGYTELNEVIGVLECAKLELYRRLVAPYEDQKIAENGDVY